MKHDVIPPTLATRLLLLLAAGATLGAPGVAQESLGERAGALERRIRRYMENREPTTIPAIWTGAPSQDAQESDEIRTVRERLKVMRFAVEAFVEVGYTAAAEAVERAMHVRELAIEGRRAEAAELREEAPNRDRLAKLLQHAARLHAEQDHPDRAEMLAALSKVYAEQWARQQRAESGEREERREPTTGDIEQLEHRMEILRFARGAWREAEKPERAAVLERFLHVAELQLGGASAAELGRAFEGMSYEHIIGLLHGAHDLYSGWGNVERARACHQLAEYYTAKTRGQTAAPDRQPDREPAQDARQEPAPADRDLSDRRRRLAILRLARAAHAEAGDLAAAEQMERVLHFAELQLEGVEGERLSEAARGLSQDLIIDLVRQAHDVCAALGQRERAIECARLAHYYRDRQEGHSEEESAARDRERQREWAGARQTEREVVGRDRIRALLERIEQVEEELRAIKSVLRGMLDD